MSSLRRTRAGAFTIEQAHTLESVQDAAAADGVGELLMNIDAMFMEHPAVTLDDTETRKCRNGAPFRKEGLADGTYRFYGTGKEFAILGEVVSGQIKIIKAFWS